MSGFHHGENQEVFQVCSSRASHLECRSGSEDLMVEQLVGLRGFLDSLATKKSLNKAVSEGILLEHVILD